MFEPKPISKDAVPAALAKAERYRFLNEPGEAESICLDVLQIEPDNQDAIVALVRSPEKAEGLGVHARAFDYARPDMLAPALAGIDTLPTAAAPARSFAVVLRIVMASPLIATLIGLKYHSRRNAQLRRLRKRPIIGANELY